MWSSGYDICFTRRGSQVQSLTCLFLADALSHLLECNARETEGNDLCFLRFAHPGVVADRSSSIRKHIGIGDGAGAQLEDKLGANQLRAAPGPHSIGGIVTLLPLKLRCYKAENRCTRNQSPVLSCMRSCSDDSSTRVQ